MGIGWLPWESYGTRLRKEGKIHYLGIFGDQIIQYKFRANLENLRLSTPRNKVVFIIKWYLLVYQKFVIFDTYVDQ